MHSDKRRFRSESSGRLRHGDGLKVSVSNKGAGQGVVEIQGEVVLFGPPWQILR